ncbi:Dna-directed rna polymerase subunit beta [Thalictrum thalictroides]|uniref:Dna-directed rna polymerase subunit beta n=1 Tax=Thalictrum thalictroides TaxID=46969 RepID=A0A7J6WAH6_THATH|nr:Dna-directed rna polymerase subunit beta [Thalictrum thalictroides]
MSSSKFNSISISVSDDEEDELAGKMRVRVRRKRKKLGFQVKKSECLRRLFIRWWAVLIFLPAIGLLLFEASRLARKTSEINENRDSQVVQETKVHGNLNRLDPTTRMFNGTRQRCLKLLPPEALEHLDIPNGESHSPVKRVIYKAAADSSNLRDNTALFLTNTETGRFNSFTGSQTLYEREQSFKVVSPSV